MKTKVIALILATVLILASATSAFAATKEVVASGFGEPVGIEPYGDSFIVADSFYNVTWKVTSGSAKTFAGAVGVYGLDNIPIGFYLDGPSQYAGFAEPVDIAPFLNGLAVTDRDANAVRFITGNQVRTLAGSSKAGKADGKGEAVQFDGPTGLATTEDGVLFIADTGNGSIRRLANDGRVTTVVKGLADPMGLDYKDGLLYVAETGKNRIITVDINNKYAIKEVAGRVISSDVPGEYQGGYADGDATGAMFNHPRDIAVADNGIIYIADTMNAAVRYIEDGKVYTLDKSQDKAGDLIQPCGVAVKGDAVYVADSYGQKIVKYSMTEEGFVDVKAGSWYYDYVYRAAKLGIVNGTTTTTFTPNAPVTRATFVVMLSRLALLDDGDLVINGDTTFKDITANTWYGGAVRWAADLGITNGSNGKYNGNASITREQMVTMLYRYMQSAGKDVSAGKNTNLSSYTDVNKVSSWSTDAFKWACGAGIVTGFPDGTLRPQATLTRAQAAKIFAELV